MFARVGLLQRRAGLGANGLLMGCGSFRCWCRESKRREWEWWKLCDLIERDDRALFTLGTEMAWVFCVREERRWFRIWSKKPPVMDHLSHGCCFLFLASFFPPLLDIPLSPFLSLSLCCSKLPGGCLNKNREAEIPWLPSCRCMCVHQMQLTYSWWFSSYFHYWSLKLLKKGKAVHVCTQYCDA